MDVYSVLTALGTLLLLAAMGAGVYVWLTFARWSESRFGRSDARLRAHDLAAALHGPGDPSSAAPRRAFLRSLALFFGLIALAVLLLELREVV